MKMLSHIPVYALVLFASLAFTSCNKKKGNCYCKFASGDKTHYDLTSLSRSEQQDSCKVIDNNANAFGGDCKLK